MAISPDGERLYVGDNVASTLFVVNTATERVEHAVPLENAGGFCPAGPDQLPAQPIGLAVSIDGLWVAATTAFCGFDCRGTVSVLNTATNEIVQTVSSEAMHAAFSADSTKLFVTLRALSRIQVIANPIGELTDQIFVRASDLSIGEDALYAPSSQGIAVISPITNEVLRTIDVAAGEMVVEADRPRGYARTLTGVVVVDLSSDSVIDQFEIPDPISLSIGTCSFKSACVGDCDNSASVTVDEIGVLINIALGQLSDTRCPYVTSTEDGVTVADIVAAVNNALRGCPQASTDSSDHEQNMGH